MKSTKRIFRSRFLSDQSGSVLILSAWSVSILGMVSILFGASSLFSLSTVNRLDENLRSYALSRAALPHVLGILQTQDQTENFDGFRDAWRTGGEALYREQRLADGSFSIRHQLYNPATGSIEIRDGVYDEESRLNLNTASTDTLKRLLSLVTDLETPEIESLADCIADWRDEDNDKLPEGAEESEYLSRRPSFEPKNGVFESIEELLFVKGMTPALLTRLRPFLTVHGNGKVNINTADKIVLGALGFSDGGVEAIHLYRLGEDGLEGTEDDMAAPALAAIGGEMGKYLSMEDLTVLGKLVSDEAIGVTSDVFGFTAEGKSEDAEYPVEIDCVVNRSGEILAWREN